MALKPVHPKVAVPTQVGVIITSLVALAAAFGVVIPDEVSAGVLAVVTGVLTVIHFLAGYNASDAPGA